jgi:hypothetical protein
MQLRLANPRGAVMAALLAVAFFIVALILQISGAHPNAPWTVDTFVIAGLACVAFHLAGIPRWPWRQ